MPNVQGFCSLLSAVDIARIDRTGRRVLERVGLRVCDPTCLRILHEAGARVDHEAQRVRFEDGWLQEMVGKAPSRVTLHARDGRRDLALGERRTHFANGGRVFRILDPANGTRRPSVLGDVARTAALVDKCEHIEAYIIACQAHDVPPGNYHLNDFYQALKHTTKHVMGGCDDVEGARQVWDLASLVAGGAEKLAERPFVSIITNPISPLTIDAKALGILRFCCERGIPVTCAPAPISGATSPVSLAGTLAQMHAEALAGVALTQVFTPGAKVLYGAVPSAMDLRKMDYTMGSVEMGMMNAAAVQLAHLYGLPIYGSAGVTEAKAPDLQAGMEKSLSLLLVAGSGADFVHLAAGMLDSGNSIAYEQYIIDDEMIGLVRRILAGIRVDEEALALEVINDVGPGGHYVLENHTVEHMVHEYYYPELSIRSQYDTWERQGRRTMVTRARERAEQILARAGDGVLDPGLARAIERSFEGIVKDPADR